MGVRVWVGFSFAILVLALITFISLSPQYVPVGQSINPFVDSNTKLNGFCSIGLTSTKSESPFDVKNAGDACCTKEDCGQDSLCCDHECKSTKNPCTDDASCSRCMAYGEAYGSSAAHGRIPAGCQAMIECVIANRVADPKRPNNACDVISQGQGSQFHAYRCATKCDSRNQQYCDCCAGNVPIPPLPAVDCSVLGGSNTFESSHSGLFDSCTKISTPSECKYPDGTNVFDFYKC